MNDILSQSFSQRMRDQLRSDQMEAVVSARNEKVTLLLAGRGWGKKTVELFACDELAQLGKAAAFVFPTRQEFEFFASQQKLPIHRDVLFGANHGRVYFAYNAMLDHSLLTAINTELIVIDTVSYFNPFKVMEIIKRTRGRILLTDTYPRPSIRSDWGTLWLKQAITDASLNGWKVISSLRSIDEGEEVSTQRQVPIFNEVAQDYQRAVDAEDVAGLNRVKEIMAQLGVAVGRNHRKSDGSIWVYPPEGEIDGSAKTLISE